FGSERKADDFNDDALGRALDALYAADPEKVYIQAVQGIQKAIRDYLIIYHKKRQGPKSNSFKILSGLM
uniref:DUF4277 domain-containing protein n=1 Tax=Lentibacillus kapialis TaxID=340214 RepID=UPI0016670BF3